MARCRFCSGLLARTVFGESVDVVAAAGCTDRDSPAAGDVDPGGARADAARSVLPSTCAAVDLHGEHELGADVCGDVRGGGADGDVDKGVRGAGEGQGDPRCGGDARVQRGGGSTVSASRRG